MGEIEVCEGDVALALAFGVGVESEIIVVCLVLDELKLVIGSGCHSRYLSLVPTPTRFVSGMRW